MDKIFCEVSENLRGKVIRTKSEAGTGDIVEAVRHMRTMNEDIAALKTKSTEALNNIATEYKIPVDLLLYVRDTQNFL